MQLAVSLNLLLLPYSIPFVILAFWPGWRSHVVASLLAIGVLVYWNHELRQVNEDNDGPGHALTMALVLGLMLPGALAGIAAGTVRLSGMRLRWWIFAALYAAFPLWALRSYFF